MLEVLLYIDVVISLLSKVSLMIMCLLGVRLLYSINPIFKSKTKKEVSRKDAPLEDDFVEDVWERESHE